MLTALPEANSSFNLCKETNSSNSLYVAIFQNHYIYHAYEL